jgi:hypothetical protein
MDFSIYDLALHTTLKVCELRGKDAILGHNKNRQYFIARCIFIRLLALRGCSDFEIAEYMKHSTQVIGRTRRVAEKMAKENQFFKVDFDFANHLLHESISVTEG